MTFVPTFILGKLSFEETPLNLGLELKYFCNIDYYFKDGAELILFTIWASIQEHLQFTRQQAKKEAIF